MGKTIPAGNNHEHTGDHPDPVENRPTHHHPTAAANTIAIITLTSLLRTLAIVHPPRAEVPGCRRPVVNDRLGGRSMYVADEASIEQ